jgi:Fe-S-cluster containining protein
MTFKPLNESLIVSAVCTECAMCCKSTVDISSATSESSVAYYKAIHLHSSKPRTEIIVTDKSIKLRTWCAQLNDDLSCGIYAARPTVCSEFNCFSRANKDKANPEYYDKIVKIIAKVHNDPDIFASA